MDFIEQLQEYWAILLFVGATIGSWAYFKFQLGDFEKRITILEDDKEEMTKILNDLKIDIAVIKETLNSIKEALQGNKKGV